MTEIAIAGVIMTGLALLFGAVLAVANRWLRVEEDPRIEQVEGLLPGSNCGACGQPGCRAFAEAIVGGAASPAGCTVASPDAIDRIARLLGIDAGSRDRRVARLHCAGGRSAVRQLADYTGLRSCRAAVLAGGGGRACPWGCLGLADCERACTFDAIHMNAENLPVVDTERCTACGDCVEACPLDLFTIEPLSHALLVQCASPLTGEAARAACAVACDACGRCALDAPPGVIEMRGGLPHILKPEAADERATFRCPTGAIVWVEGDQFVSPAARRTRRQHA